MRWAVACAAVLLAPFAASLIAHSPAIMADEKTPAGLTVQDDIVYGRVHGAGLLAFIEKMSAKEQP